LFSVLSVLCITPAFAGWQYDGYYINDGYYEDDYMQFVIGLRGGLSWANAKVGNDVGNLYGYYYISQTTGDVVSALAWAAAGEPTGYINAGYGDLSTLKAKENFSKMAFTAGGSIGLTIPYHPKWRLEAGYDHIAETNYNQIPLFEGDLSVTGGDIGNAVVHVSSGGATSTISTDVISVMANYDFFEGYKKPLNQIIPYVGLGLGYATSKTTLKLADIYGDLSTDSDLQNYGTPDEDGVLQFEPPSDKSKYPSSENLAVLGAFGLSYGVSQYTFLDFSARVMYIPKINWHLVNSDGSLHRDWFSVKDMIYTNLMVGVRFGF
jgi:hypothetical protein